MEASHLRGSEDVPNQKRKRQKPARYQTDSDSDGIIRVKSERVSDSDSESDNSKRHKTPELPKNNELDSSTSKNISISCREATDKTKQSMDASPLRGNYSEDVPPQKRKIKKPARYQSASSGSESDSIVDNSMNTQNRKRQKPAWYKTHSNSNEITQVKPERLTGSASESSSIVDNSVNRSHMNGNCSKDVPNQKHKGQKSARTDSNSNEIIQIKSERLSDSGSERDSVVDSSRRHKISDLSENNELGSNTSILSSTSQGHVSNNSTGSELEQAALSFEERVLRWMEQTERMLESQAHTLNLILALLQSRSGERDPMMVDDIPKLPLKTKDEMDDFEAYLQNSSNFSKMVVHLSGKGGHTVQQTTRRIFNSIMALELLSIYNWAGRGKIAFRSTATKQLIIFGRLFHELEKINRKLDALHDKVDRLGMTNNGSTDISTTFHPLPENVKLPVTSLEELDELNNRLKKDKQLSKNLVGYLFHAGSGKSQRSFLMSITKKVLAQKIAIQFSRFGRKGKKPFIDYNETLHVILAAAAMKFKEVEREDLAEMFGKCLASAVDWNCRRPRPSDFSFKID